MRASRARDASTDLARPSAVAIRSTPSGKATRIGTALSAVGLAQPLTLTDIADNFRLLYDAFEGLHLDEDLLFGDERFACARWRLRGLHVGDYMGFAPKGQSIDVETCEIYEVSDGLVVASWVYGDLGQLFRQIGAEPGDAT